MTIKNLKIGSKDISKMYIGKRISDTIYLGNEKVYENPQGLILEQVNITLIDDNGNFSAFSNDVDYSGIISKLINCQVDMNGHTYGNFTHNIDNSGFLLIGSLIVDTTYNMQQCDTVTFKDSSDYDANDTGTGKFVLTGDRGTLNNISLQSGRIAIKPSHGCKITNMNINGGRVYIIADNLDLDISIDSGTVYLVTNNSTGTLTINGGTVCLSGKDNCIEMNISDGQIYIDNPDQYEVGEWDDYLKSFLTTFTGKIVEDIYYSEDFGNIIVFEDGTEWQNYSCFIDVWGRI